MKNLISSWFRVDSRALGIYRILIGWVCVLDIIRRWNYIDVFYSNQGIPMHSDSKAFNIFDYIGNGSLEGKQSHRLCDVDSRVVGNSGRMFK